MGWFLGLEDDACTYMLTGNMLTVSNPAPRILSYILVSNHDALNNDHWGLPLILRLVYGREEALVGESENGRKMNREKWSTGQDTTMPDSPEWLSLQRPCSGGFAFKHHFADLPRVVIRSRMTGSVCGEHCIAQHHD